MKAIEIDVTVSDVAQETADRWTVTVLLSIGGFETYGRIHFTHVFRPKDYGVLPSEFDTPKIEIDSWDCAFGGNAEYLNDSGLLYGMHRMLVIAKDFHDKVLAHDNRHLLVEDWAVSWGA